MQPGDDEAEGLDHGADAARLGRVDQLGRGGQREGRDLEPVVAERGRRFALALEREAGEDLVAEGQLHVSAPRVPRREKMPLTMAPAPPVTRCTPALNGGT